jgi:glycopeptide antibiotics resistance protein
MDILIEAAAALLLIIPAFWILNILRFHSSRRTWRYTLFALYLAAVYQIVGLPTVLFLTFDATVNLIPFLHWKEDLKNAILNVILFVPLGFFLPALWQRYRKLGETLLVGFCATLAIELGQLLTYRVTDINDILTNFLGSFAGYVLFRILFLFRGRKTGSAGKNTDLWIILGTVGMVMFFLQPLAASLFYMLT